MLGSKLLLLYLEIAFLWGNLFKIFKYINHKYLYLLFNILSIECFIYNSKQEVHIW